jgi:hypothetical protein
MKAKIIEVNLLDKISAQGIEIIHKELEEKSEISSGKILKKHKYLYPHKEPFFVKDLIELKRLSK